MMRRQGAYRPQCSDLRLRSLNLIKLIMKDLQDFFHLKKISLHISSAFKQFLNYAAYELWLIFRVM